MEIKSRFRQRSEPIKQVHSLAGRDDKRDNGEEAAAAHQFHKLKVVGSNPTSVIRFICD